MSFCLQVPARLTHLAERPEGAAWLRELPLRLVRCVQKWRLRLESIYPGSSVSLVCRATLPDGSPAVLKIQWPHSESLHEADALRLWNGNGAVRLLAEDGSEHALLIECCEPGHPLSSVGQEQALDVLSERLPRLWVPAGPPFRTLVEECAGWRKQLAIDWDLAGRPFERTLLEGALEAMDHLLANPRGCVLVHQDLHTDNVLQSRREPWLAIDPKPLIGEKEFSVAPAIRGSELGHCRTAIVQRLDRLSAALQLDRERCRMWTLAQTLAWVFEGSTVLASHVEAARWLMQA